ncbi:hypothetical protein ACQPYK_21695 [Streptosporangium sp. CA-135522]|uniref:hypothetical protein n=1 Tax=Streptosporangium sp. CA-135522 TaxID=3240072 RepID=UPI003D8F9629
MWIQACLGPVRDVPAVHAADERRPGAVRGRLDGRSPEGVELLRGAAGGNPHTLVADPDTCRWTTDVSDSDGPAIGVFMTSAVVYLLHPEHGATGCTPGSYAVRRQHEHERRRARLVAD